MEIREEEEEEEEYECDGESGRVIYSKGSDRIYLLLVGELNLNIFSNWQAASFLISAVVALFEGLFITWAPSNSLLIKLFSAFWLIPAASRL